MKRLIAVLAIGVAGLSGCSTFHATAYGNGFAAGAVLARTQTLRENGPAAQCALFDKQGLRIATDNRSQWLAGCEAALAHARFKRQ